MLSSVRVSYCTVAVAPSNASDGAGEHSHCKHTLELSPLLLLGFIIFHFICFSSSFFILFHVNVDGVRKKTFSYAFFVYNSFRWKMRFHFIQIFRFIVLWVKSCWAASAARSGADYKFKEYNWCSNETMWTQLFWILWLGLCGNWHCHRWGIRNFIISWCDGSNSNGRSIRIAVIGRHLANSRSWWRLTK